MRGSGAFAFGAVALAACGGDGDGESGAPSGDDDDAPLACSLPNYDLDTATCEQLGTAWTNTVAAGGACNTAADCVVRVAECEHWPEVSCFYAVNAACITADVMGAFNAAAGDCANDDVCVCGEVPSADCVGGACVVAEAR